MRYIKGGFASLALGIAATSLGAEVGYWSFDEGAGNLIGDGSGLANVGTLMNATGSTWISGKSGSALYFDGTVGAGGARVEIADSASLRLSNAASFAAWVWCDDISRDAPVFAKEGPGGALSYWFGAFGSSGAGHWGALLDQNGDQPWEFNGRDQGSVDAGQWVHLAVTWDGSTVSYYKNGALTNTASWGGVINQSNARLFIGSNSEYTFQGNATAFKGGVDEVHIYDTAISADDVAELAAVPEPASMAVLALGAAALAARRRRR